MGKTEGWSAVDRLTLIVCYLIAASWSVSVCLRLIPGSHFQVPATIDMAWTSLVGVLLADWAVRKRRR